jgi:hypothetical protein
MPSRMLSAVTSSPTTSNVIPGEFSVPEDRQLDAGLFPRSLVSNEKMRTEISSAFRKKIEQMPEAYIQQLAYKLSDQIVADFPADHSFSTISDLSILIFDSNFEVAGADTQKIKSDDVYHDVFDILLTVKRETTDSYYDPVTAINNYMKLQQGS